MLLGLVVTGCGEEHAPGTVIQGPRSSDRKGDSANAPDLGLADGPADLLPGDRSMSPDAPAVDPCSEVESAIYCLAPDGTRSYDSSVATTLVTCQSGTTHSRTTCPAGCVAGLIDRAPFCQVPAPPRDQFVRCAYGEVVDSYRGIEAHCNNSATDSFGSFSGRWQCDELVNRYLDAIYGLPPLDDWITEFAKDLCSHAAARPDDFQVYGAGYGDPAAHSPEANDILVWTGFTPGHTAIVTHVLPDRIVYIQQNIQGHGEDMPRASRAWSQATSTFTDPDSPACWIKIKRAPLPPHEGAPATGPLPHSCLDEGDYCGGTLLGDRKVLYSCQARGTAPRIKATCSAECQANRPGGADQCPPPPGQCPDVGTYCGASVGMDPHHLYSCGARGADPVSIETCHDGCTVEPPSVPDHCTPPPGPCPDQGWYCGSVLGLNRQTVYECDHRGANPTGTLCSNGCKVESPGVPDHCIQPPGSCPGHGFFCGPVVDKAPHTVYQCAAAGATPVLYCTSWAMCGGTPGHDHCGS
jgi:hypothetical protein